MPSLPDLFYRLAILNEVAAGKPLSQRSLAARLEVSLGQANKLLRGLEEEGLIRVDAEGAARYTLTASGRRARMEAASQFAAMSRALLKPLRRRLGRHHGVKTPLPRNAMGHSRKDVIVGTFASLRVTKGRAPLSRMGKPPPAKEDRRRE